MSKLALVCMVVLASFTLSGVALSRGGPDRDFQREALLGSYACSAGESQAFLSLQLNATGDVLADETDLFRTVPVATTPDEVCALHVQAALEALTSCAVSPVQVSDDGSGDFRSFQFVCSGGRSRIIQTLTAVSAALLTSSP